MNCDICGHNQDRHNFYGCLHRKGERMVHRPLPGIPDYEEAVYDRRVPICSCGAAFGGSPVRVAEWILIGANND